MNHKGLKKYQGRRDQIVKVDNFKVIKMIKVMI